MASNRLAILQRRKEVSGGIRVTAIEPNVLRVCVPGKGGRELEIPAQPDLSRTTPISASFFGLPPYRLAREQNLTLQDKTGVDRIQSILSGALSLLHLDNRLDPDDLDVRPDALLCQSLKPSTSNPELAGIMPLVRGGLFELDTRPVAAGERPMTLQCLRQPQWLKWMNQPHPSGEPVVVPLGALSQEPGPLFSELLDMGTPLLVEIEEARSDDLIVQAILNQRWLTDIDLRALADEGAGHLVRFKQAWTFSGISAPATVRAPGDYAMLSTAWGIALEAIGAARMASSTPEGLWLDRRQRATCLDLAQCLSHTGSCRVLATGLGRVELAVSHSVEAIAQTALEAGFLLYGQQGLVTVGNGDGCGVYAKLLYNQQHKQLSQADGWAIEQAKKYSRY